MSLGDLKKAKKRKVLFKKKSSQIELDFFYSELPSEFRTSLFIAFSLLGTKIGPFFGVKFNFELLFFLKNVLIWRKITLKVNKYHVFTQNFNHR